MKLIRHPESPEVHDFAVEAEVLRTADQLTFRYTVSGGVGAILLPPPGIMQRADGLWRSTCFEAFTRGDGDSYAELNFAPQGGWAAYHFDDYRQGQVDLDVEVHFNRVEREMSLVASIMLPAEIARADTLLALSAVVEDVEGRKSYWALAHADGPPDFHHPDCFVARLP